MHLPCKASRCSWWSRASRAPACPHAAPRSTCAIVGSYRAAFVTNSRGIVPVGRIDDVAVAVDADLMRTVAEVVGSVPWDTI